MTSSKALVAQWVHSGCTPLIIILANQSKMAQFSDGFSMFCSSIMYVRIYKTLKMYMYLKIR